MKKMEKGEDREIGERKEENVKKKLLNWEREEELT